MRCDPNGVVAGEFINLTFDKADVSRIRLNPSTGFLSGPVQELLRGWEVSIRQPFGEWSSFRDEIPFVSEGAPFIPISLNWGMHVDHTDLSVFLYSIPATGFPPGSSPPDVRLSTTGTVPENALTFDWYRGAGLELTISDGIRTLSKQGAETSMNVTQFAGKEVTISFIQRSRGFDGVDVIGFSLVPEPETWALFGIGLVGLFAWRQCNKP